MRPKLLLFLLAALAVGSVIAFGLLKTSGGAGQVSAQALLTKAAQADIKPDPNTVLHVRTRIFLRTKPRALRLSDPYHLDRYTAVPEVTIGDAWFEADSSGTIVRRYTALTDLDGNLVQEESRTSTIEEYLYSVADNIVERIPLDPNSLGGVFETGSVVDQRPGAVTRTIGQATVAGLRIDEVEVRADPVELTPAEAAYERPYVRDLSPTSVRETFGIIPETGAILGHSIDLIDGDKSTRVSERLVELVETVEPADLPAGFFDLRHADGVPRLREDINAANPGAFTTDALDDPRLQGKPLVTVSDPTALGLSFSGIHGAESTVSPPPGARDARAASAFGLALTAEYRGTNAAGAGTPPTLRITTGARADLLPLLQSSLPYWSRSSLVTVTVFGTSTDAWLLEGKSGAAVILERDGGIVMWDAQGFEASSLLRMVSSSLEVNG